MGKTAGDIGEMIVESSRPGNRSAILTISVALLLTALSLTALFCSRNTDGWKGRIYEEDGVIVVRNPDEPLYGPDALSFEQDLVIGEEESAGYVFASISSIAVDGQGEIFVVDFEDKNVKVFGRDGRRTGTIGRPGQGPGEFRAPRVVEINGRGEIVVFDAGSRLVFFGRGGEHLRTQLIRPLLRRFGSDASLFLFDLRSDTLGNYFIHVGIREVDDPHYELRKVDGEFRDLFRLESWPQQDVIRDGINPYFPWLRWAPLSGGRVVCGLDAKYELRIYDAEGHLARKIQMDPEPVLVTEEDVLDQFDDISPETLKTYDIPKNLPAFRHVVTDDEDRIWVLSWARPPGRPGYYADVFDPNGKYLVRTVLTTRRLFFRGGYLYAAEETADGTPVLKRYRLKWNFRKK